MENTQQPGDQSGIPYPQLVNELRHMMDGYHLVMADMRKFRASERERLRDVENALTRLVQACHPYAESQWINVLNGSYGEDVDGTPLLDAVEAALKLVPDALPVKNDEIAKV